MSHPTPALPKRLQLISLRLFLMTLQEEELKPFILLATHLLREIRSSPLTQSSTSLPWTGHLRLRFEAFSGQFLVNPCHPQPQDERLSAPRPPARRASAQWSLRADFCLPPVPDWGPLCSSPGWVLHVEHESGHGFKNIDPRFVTKR